MQTPHSSIQQALLDKYHPERKQAKKVRLSAVVQVLAQSSRILTHRDTKKTIFAKYGLRFVTAPIEAKKAALVVIAHDVDPIELVIFLPAFCGKISVPYVIVLISSSMYGAEVFVARSLRTCQ